MRQWLSCLMVWAMLCISSWSYAAFSFQSTDVAQLQEGHQLLGQRLYDLPDPEQQYQPEQLIKNADLYPWHLNQRAEPNFGFHDEPRWFLLHFHNSQPTDVQRMLELSYPLMDQVDFYVVRNGQIEKKINMGDQRPMSQRPIDHRHFLVPLDFAAHDHIQVLMRVETTGSLQMPLTIWDLREFFKHDQIVYSFQLMFLGIMFGLALYNFFLFIATRDLSYFYYVGSLVSITGVILCLYGLPAQFVWPEYPKLNNFSLVASISTSLIFASVFAYRFLRLHRYNRFIRGTCLSITIMGGLLFIGNLVLPYNIAIRAGTSMTVIEAIAAIAIGLYLWRRGEPLARFYTIAWFAFLFGTVMLILSKWGMIPRNIVVENIQPIGFVAEGLLLSLALAYRMNLHRRKRYQAQLHLFNMQKEANMILEQRVQERTAALEEANRQLKELNQRDGLTGVYNRAFFEEKLQHEWNKGTRADVHLGLLMIDGDGFKKINDQYGHLCGDACLKHFAKLFAQTVTRAGDFVARYGGEEFVLLLCHIHLDNAAFVAEKIRRLIAETPFVWEGQQISLSVSIGVACAIPQAFVDAKQLVKTADEACYQAKHAGRNQVMVATDQGAIAYAQFISDQQFRLQPS